MTAPAGRSGERGERARALRGAGSPNGETAARTWPAVVAATALAIAGAAAIWYLAVPRHDICPAIYPVPPGCGTADRVSAGLVATGGLVVALVVAVVLLRTAARGHPGRAAAVLAVLGLVAIALTNVVRLT